jgi:PTS system nitrogen regulatory IIA component
MPEMNLADLLAPGRVIVDLRATDKASALRALARRAATETDLAAASIEAALASREALGSTGLGGGIALPHARLAELDRFVGLFARLPRAIEFEAIDGKKVDLVFVLLAPAADSADHVKALAAIARRLRDAPTVAAIRRAADPAAIYQLLIGSGS